VGGVGGGGNWDDKLIVRKKSRGSLGKHPENKHLSKKEKHFCTVVDATTCFP